MTPSLRHRRLIALASLGAAAAVLAGCATAAPGSPNTSAPLGTVWPSPPTGDVVAQGTVMDIGGTVELCLGAVAESYPPQCSGLPLAGWSWDGIDGAESSGDVTWGAYAVQGTYDGETFTVTQPPIMLALYDPMMIEDPTGGVPGAGDEADLIAIQDQLPDRLGEAYLSSYPQDGWLWVDVVWDDGTWQQAADAEFGDDMVVVRSALRSLGG